MSNVINLGKKKGMFNVSVTAGADYESENHVSELELFKIQLEEEYQKGFREGSDVTRKGLEKNFNAKLTQEKNSSAKFIAEMDSQLIEYEKKLSELVTNLSIQIARKIIQKEIILESPIVETIKATSKSLIGSAHMVIKAHSDEIKKIQESGLSLFTEGNLAKIKFDSDDRIEMGGFIIESDIGNIDGQINSQLNEIKKVLESENYFQEEEK